MSPRLSQEMDKNKDGVISFDEFCEWCQKVSNSWNKTGMKKKTTVSLEEVFFPDYSSVING
jgi:Ca2+-binding EF-hand superfamily protein